ncbi:MAG: HTH domain-containing protein [Treponema sp.]|jgi:DNA-binding LacI/PurR family transcriptional regulator|nr:HTH domain-containing protein [Treponema sp.]
MPKKILDSFFHSMVRDIKNNRQPGDRYFSIREISEHFKVSVQTAQRGVKRLEEYGYISIKRKAGITVESLGPQKVLDRYRIAVVSAKADTRFNDAYMRGINAEAAGKGVSVDFIQVPEIDIRSLKFGDYLLSLDADGIIALYFRNSALPFYHVLREGKDIVNDMIIDELPVLPSVQTDNFRHAQEAGRLFLEQDYRRFLVAGHFPLKRNRRYEGICDVLKNCCDSIRYVCLGDHDSIKEINSFFSAFDKHSAVFSVDYSSNYITAAMFMQHHLEVKNNNFLVYDCEEEYFSYHGLKPVKKVGPSIFTIGRELCHTLIAKRETGAYPLPLQRKI